MLHEGAILNVDSYFLNNDIRYAVADVKIIINKLRLARLFALVDIVVETASQNVIYYICYICIISIYYGSNTYFTYYLTFNLNAYSLL